MKDESGRDVVRAFVKGAPDQLLDRSTSTLDWHLAPLELNDELRQRYNDENQRLAEQGLRVLATGRKDFEPDHFDPNADLLELMNGLTVLTLVGIVDPPRPTAKASIATAKEAGIRVRMITGDHAITAAAIANELGIEGRAITGAEFAAMSDDEVQASIDGIGVIARVTPEDKVRLVDNLKKKNLIVAMTGDGVNDAPALKRADIGIAMGITGTEVSKEAAAMILTDDNFSTIVKAVEMGRGLYDNLTKYIRFQMGVLVGMVLTFLSASIFNIVGGIPFLPLQTLYHNFTTQVFQAVGLGYGKPAEGLMKRKPRPSDEPLLPRSLMLWLGTAGLVMALGTLAVAWWGDDEHGIAFGRTMAFTTFALFNLFFSFTCRDERRSIFSLETFDDGKFLLASGLSVVAIVLGTEFSLFQRFLDTTGLSLEQWLLCIAVALTIVAVSEVRKVFLRRRPEPVPAEEKTPAAVGAPSGA
jgi:Ca2+-transporting ATPase